jgi:hypothetical protein
VVGARRRTQLSEALGALQVKLTPRDITAIEDALPASAVVGTRYPVPVMSTLDSEREEVVR